jgi:hypothetical protein
MPKRTQLQTKSTSNLLISSAAQRSAAQRSAAQRSAAHKMSLSSGGVTIAADEVAATSSQKMFAQAKSVSPQLLQAARLKRKEILSHS